MGGSSEEFRMADCKGGERMILSMISRILKLSGKYSKRIKLAFVFSVFDAILSKMPILYAMLVPAAES